ALRRGRLHRAPGDAQGDDRRARCPFVTAIPATATTPGTAATPGAGAASPSPADRYLGDEGAFGLFTRLQRVGLLLDAFQHRCFVGFGLGFIDYPVLGVRRLADPPYQMTPSELTDLLLRSSGGMTQILDRLESAGLVERSSDPGDRRRV